MSAVLRTISVLILTVIASAAAAQLSGRVVDSTNAVLPGVTVETQGETTITRSDGTYSLALPPGTYDVSFSLVNFATSIRRGVIVGAGNTARLDATLYLAASADVVVT